MGSIRLLVSLEVRAGVRFLHFSAHEESNGPVRLIRWGWEVCPATYLSEGTCLYVNWRAVYGFLVHWTLAPFRFITLLCWSGWPRGTVRRTGKSAMLSTYRTRR